MGKSAPSAPNPYQTAQAQTQSNEQTASYNQQLNMLDSSGPNGTVTYTPSGAPGGYTQTTSLSPAEQAIFNQQTSAEGGALGIANDQLGRVSGALDTSLTPSNYGQLSYGASGGAMAGGVSSPALQTGYANGQPLQGLYSLGDAVQSSISPQGPVATSYGSGGQVQGQVAPSGSIDTALGGQGSIASGYGVGGQIQGQVAQGAQGGQAVQNASDAAYDQATRYLTPQYQQQNEQLQAQLTAQGLNPNDAAWQNAETLQNNQQNLGYEGAVDSAISAGDTEQNTLFGQALSSGQFANSAQQQANAENAQQASFGNSAQQQGYSEALGAGEFANSAQQQQYGENLSSGQFANSAQEQQNAQNAQAASFQDAGQQQGYEQALGEGQFANSGQAQQAGENAGLAAFENSAAGQQYAQSQGDASFYNTAGESSFQNQLAAAELQNSEQQQAYGENYQNAGLNDSAQQQGFNEAAYSTELPINELSSLLGLGQVSSPTGVGYTPAAAQSTDVGQIVQQSYGDQLAAYNANVAQQKSTLGGLFNLATAF